MMAFQPGITEFDGTPDTLLVVSDLHLGVGQNPLTLKYEPRENFLADDAFHALLIAHDPSQKGSALLVLNGDIWDFLRVTELPDSEADLLHWQAALKELGVEKTLTELRKR